MKPGLMRRMSKELAYISWERSLAVQKKFPTIQSMANASKEDWISIEGFGEVIAHSAVRELQT
jgi:DNA integrity scanning protein DisA with diadenylate cyclase activity